MTFKPFHHLTLRVSSIKRLGNAIVCLELEDPDGWELPPFTAGAHLDLHLPEAGVRQYSLSGDPAVRNRYEIAVRRIGDGRGGSRWIHDKLSVGDVVYSSLPRNHFSLGPAYAEYILIAGGIGITPLRSMTFELGRAGKPYSLWYCARDEAHAAYVDELRARVPRERLSLTFTGPEQSARLDFGALLREARADTAVYCCGPSTLMNAVREATRHWPREAVHFEAFAPACAVEPGAEHAFEVELARSHRTISVQEGQTILQALREHGVEVESSCEAGVCRACKTDYLDGLPVHRDLVLSVDERRTSMLICVSGCSSKRIVLDR